MRFFSTAVIDRVTYAPSIYVYCLLIHVCSIPNEEDIFWLEYIGQNMLSDDCEMSRFSRNKLFVAHRLLLPAPVVSDGMINYTDFFIRSVFSENRKHPC